MAIELFVNGQALELDHDTNIKYSKQIADIFDISKVNTSYTNSFSIPKTKVNSRIFQGLGLVGSTSQIPYQKITVSLKDNGFDVIKSGWLDVKETSERYKLNIKDGSIDFFKDIENINIGDIELSEIDHQKTLSNVIDSFTNEDYRYIVGDYNGKTLVSGNINIDYLVPSARYKYLLDKICAYFNWNKQGSIFSNEDYLDSWITFPKSTDEDIDATELIATMRKNAVSAYWFPQFESNVGLVYPQMQNWSSSTITEGTLLDNWRFEAPENNQYYITVKSRGFIQKTVRNPFEIAVLKNGTILGVPLAVYDSAPVYETTYIGNLQAGDVLDFKYKVPSGTIRMVHDFTDIEIYKNILPEVSFTDNFKTFKVKDFLFDFIRRFGLSLIVDNETRTLNFYTINERLNRNNAIDWTSKYKRRINEIYVDSSYAQKNYYRHKYNGENEDFNDGVLQVSNKNLADEKTLATTPFYSRTKNIVDLSGFTTYSYPIWERSPKETDSGVEVDYKGLSGRFYVIKDKTKTQNRNFISEISGSSDSVTSFPIINALNTHYAELIPKYYERYGEILNNCKIHNIEVALTLLDIINLDFSKPIYFEQEASYYLLNKVDWESGKESKIEAIKINMSAESSEEPTYNHVLAFSEGCFTITNFEPYVLFFQFSYNDGANWETGSVYVNENPSCGYFTSQPVLFRLIDINGDVVSNTIEIIP